MCTDAAFLFGNSFISSCKIDFEALFADSSSNKPIVLTYSEEADTLKRYFVQCAKSKGSEVSFAIVDVNALGLSDEMHIKRAVVKAIEEVSRPFAFRMCIALSLSVHCESREVGFCSTTCTTR